MTIKIYVLPSNGSSRKTEKYFKDNGIEYTRHQMISTPLTWKQLLEILSHTENGVEDIISTSGKAYKELTEQGIDFDEMSLTELHYIIKRYPTLIKAPIVVGRDTTMVGYSDEGMKLWGNRESREKEFKDVLHKLREEEDEVLREMLAKEEEEKLREMLAEEEDRYEDDFEVVV